MQASSEKNKIGHVTTLSGSTQDLHQAPVDTLPLTLTFFDEQDDDLASIDQRTTQ
jgi:hypothetical protein